MKFESWESNCSDLALPWLQIIGKLPERGVMPSLSLRLIYVHKKQMSPCYGWNY